MDFLISQTGDLVFSEKSIDENTLIVKFYRSHALALKIDFNVNRTLEENISSRDNLLIVNFLVPEKKNNKDVVLANGVTFIAQQVLIRLKTALGELPYRKDIGSELERVFHKNLQSKEVHSLIKGVAANAIKDLLPECEIKIVPRTNFSNEFPMAIDLYIYDNDRFIVQYQAGW